MERVVTINLNGNSYQLEEPAYDALRLYVARAESALTDNPDKAEIVRDLEQAVADKCATYLSAGKTVVTGAEMGRILDEMGPVGDSSDAAGGGGSSAGDHPRKRLYRITADAKVAGVCSGIGAFFDIDPNIVRLVFIVGALLTSGAVALLYVALMFLIPSAQTSEEWAAAHGVPFNAQEVIDRAKREYSQFASADGPPWRGRREQRRAWRMNGDRWGARTPDPNAKPVGYVTRIIAGLFAFILSIVTAALLIAFLVVFFSLLTTGAVFGWSPPVSLPLWLAIVILVIVYAAISSPFKLLRRTSYAAASGYRDYGRGDGLVTFAAVLVGGVLAYQFIPDFQHMIDALPHDFPVLRINLN